MPSQINKVAVIGLNIGAGIAAHLTNVGLPVLLLEVVPFTDRLFRDRAARRRFVENQYEQLAYKTPAAPDPNRTDRRDLLTFGNLADEFDQLAECDWIIDAMPEPMGLKQLPLFMQQLAQRFLILWLAWQPQAATSATYPNQALMKQLETVRQPEAIVSNGVVNVTGFPLDKVAEGCSAAFKRYFLGAFFSAPVRYTTLLEVRPTPETAPDVLNSLREFCQSKLGRDIVICPDTPDFINNRLMADFGSHDQNAALENNYSVEAADAITGVLIGRPDITLTFRVLDSVGLELMALLNANLYPAIADDPGRDVLRNKKSQSLFRKMMIATWLGQSRTFYKDKVDKNTDDPSYVQVLDLPTQTYKPFQAPHFDSVTAVQGIEDLGERLKALLAYPESDRAASFARQSLYFDLAYAASLAPRIAHTVADVDMAVRAGSLLYVAGPFEIWDMLGVAETVTKMEAAGFTVADWVKQMLAAGHSRFYQDNRYYDFNTRQYSQAAKPIALIGDLRHVGQEIARNEFARLRDMGDGVGLLEFHKNPTSYLFSNTIDDGTVQMTYTALERLQTDFEALVVGNNGRNFSSGANIAGVLELLEQGAWDQLSAVILAIGQAALKLRQAPKPVVTAPHHISVGAGTVLAMTGWKSVAALEINLGFAEVNLGVIAAAGGCKETLRVKVNPALRAGTTDVVSVVRKAFQQLATSKLSNTAWEAKSLGYLRETDTVRVNSNDLLGEAKRQALELVASRAKPQELEQVYVAGPDARAVLEDDIQRMIRAGQINDYLGRVMGKTAFVICGGDIRAPAWVDPNRILELECEAFLALLGEQKTIERLTTFVKTGRLLNN